MTIIEIEENLYHHEKLSPKQYFKFYKSVSDANIVHWSLSPPARPKDFQ